MQSPKKFLVLCVAAAAFSFALGQGLARAEDRKEGSRVTEPGGEADEIPDPRTPEQKRMGRGPGQVALENKIAAGAGIIYDYLAEKGRLAQYDLSQYLARKSRAFWNKHVKANFVSSDFPPPETPLGFKPIMVNCQGLEAYAPLRKIDMDLQQMEQAFANVKKSATAYREQGCPKVKNSDGKVKAEVTALYKAAAADARNWETITGSLKTFGPVLAEEMDAMDRRDVPVAAHCAALLRRMESVSDQVFETTRKNLACDTGKERSWDEALGEWYKRFKNNW